jgi:hypothetical protein
VDVGVGRLAVALGREAGQGEGEDFSYFWPGGTESKAADPAASGRFIVDLHLSHFVSNRHVCLRVNRLRVIRLTPHVASNICTFDMARSTLQPAASLPFASKLRGIIAQSQMLDATISPARKPYALVRSSQSAR